VSHLGGCSWYTCLMPTKLKRHQITEVPEIAQALSVAENAWPQETSRTKLIQRLVVLGAQTLEVDPEVRLRARVAQVGALTGRYPSQLGSDYLDDLRAEWDQ